MEWFIRGKRMEDIHVVVVDGVVDSMELGEV